MSMSSAGFRAGGRRPWGRYTRPTAAWMCLIVVLGMTVALPTTAAAVDCTENEITCENQLAGTPESVWNIDGAGDESIQGFATQMSVPRGQTVDFKIKTDAAAYRIEVYRLGYYQGNGARKVADVTPSATLPQSQPACATDPATEIYDCGTWSVSASWAVPSTAVSGVYIARLIRADTDGTSHIPFVVRNDAAAGKVMFQTSDTTWQAYNSYGGSSLYRGLVNGRAYKLSYNRPFATRGGVEKRDFLFANEYPMIRFLESNGYDMTYISGLDTDVRGQQILAQKAFLSVGHDEYWSAGQRTNVEAARNAGVNLAFFSGNEIYWKIRWEPSQDGSNTPNRTMVSYKDTFSNTVLDPQGPTGTWRDPRFQPAIPENALTGTAYKSNYTDLPITVSAEEGRLRLWRNTPLATQADGTSTELAPHTVGYESDEDLDNGYRPAGLIRLSTTTGPSPEYLQDFGTKVAAGTTTHHLTMYRAGSGALVFSAGTVQWAWGLDTRHDGTVEPVSVPMQQATVNLLADMGAAATSLTTPGVVPATASTDRAAPTAVITAPTAQTPIPQGTTVTVTGTAQDAGGGIVGGVEVSLDGGSTWHPAQGRSPFSYTGVVTATGASTIQARATDDSGNIQPQPAVVAAAVDCPCSIFGDATPTTPATPDASPVTLGTRFTSAENGFVTGLRFYKGAGNTGTHTGTLYKDDGTVLSTIDFANETAAGWQSAVFPTAVPVTAGATYVAAYRAPNGFYAADTNYFAYSGTTAGPLTALGGYQNPNGVFSTGAGIPTGTYQQTNYYVDVLYSPTDSTPLSVVSATPLSGAGSVPTSTTVSATFSRDPTADSIVFGLQDADGRPVGGTTGYDGATRTATFTPAAPLPAGATYTATVTANAAGVGPMTAPSTWTFATARPDATPGVCPCGMYNDGDVPVVVTAADPNGVELGMAFTPDNDGAVEGVRFYKGPTNTGAHTVSLWTAAGERLATAPVGAESTMGWQSATFDATVPVTAGATYIVSYRAPVGRYSYTAGALAAAKDKPPLHTPANAGRYTYGAGAPLTPSAAGYFVDPVFALAPGQPPTLARIAPADQSTSVPVTTVVSATFDGPIQPGSAAITLTGPDGAVTGTTATDPARTTVTFTPGSALAESATYTVTVNGATNLGGVPMTSPATSTFRTSGLAACPCSLLSTTTQPPIVDSGETRPVSVGLRFSTDSDGFVTGLRYYRAAANTGTHTGSLYSTGGIKLAGLTFTDSGTGWQTATFSGPVAVTAGTSYIAQVYMPDGHYSAAPAFFAGPVVNGPLTGTLGTFTYGSDTFPSSSWNSSHYFVDVTYTNQDTSAPTISATTPADGATAQLGSTVTATFDRPIDPASLDVSVAVTGGASITGTVGYDAASRTATFTPTTTLPADTQLTASVGASSTGGVPMPQKVSWQFATVAAAPTGESSSLYTATDTPATEAWPDAGPVTVGIRFTPSRSGTVTAVKFFAGAGNNGPYDVAIWSIGGTKLGSARAIGNASGWKTVVLERPVSVDAGTTYLASYRGASGRYAVTGGGLRSGKTVGPLSIPANGSVYSYPDAAPTGNLSTEFFVDVIAVLDPAAAPPPTVTATTPATSTTAKAQPNAVMTATFEADIDPDSLAFTVTRAAGGAAVTGSTTYDPSSRTAMFTPPDPLEFGSTFNASITARSTAGIAMAAPATWSFTTVAEPAAGTQYGLYSPESIPTNAAWNDGGPVTVGVRFSTAQAGSVTAVKFYAGPGNTGPWTVDIWNASGQRLGGGTATGPASGWKTVLLDESVAIEPGAEYRASYRGATGRYAVTSGGLSGAQTIGPLSTPANGGVFTYPVGAPSRTTSTDFGVDVVVVVP